MEKVKSLIFYKRTYLNDALKFPLCLKLYNSLNKTKGEAFAKEEALLLCNDVLWAMCIYLFENKEWGQKYELPKSGISYDWRWVFAQLTDCMMNNENDNSLVDIMASLYASSVVFDVDYQDKQLKELYLEIRHTTIKTWPKLLEFNGVTEIIKIAPIDKWPPLLEVGFFSLSRKLRELIVSELYSNAKSKDELCKVRDLLNTYVFHYSNYKIVPEYNFLCRIKIELQEDDAERLRRLSDTEEGKTLEVRRAGKYLDTNTLKATLERMLNQGDIPTGNRDGYVWYAVWLFFKKNRLLKDNSQRAFHRLMKSWFPKSDYGHDDRMRIYNSEYLERYNWQIWKYYEFKERASAKASERGFNAIKKLYEELECNINIANLWVNPY